MGVPLGRTKLLAFALSGFIAGYAGVCLAFATERISTSTFDPTLLGPGRLDGGHRRPRVDRRGRARRPLPGRAAGHVRDHARPSSSSPAGSACWPSSSTCPAAWPSSCTGSADLVTGWPRALARIRPGRPADAGRPDSVGPRRRRDDALGERGRTDRRSRGPARLEVRGVVVDFGGVRAVDGVDLVAEPGAIVGLIGPNGSGKTTLLDVDLRAGPPRGRGRCASTARAWSSTCPRSGPRSGSCAPSRTAGSSPS